MISQVADPNIALTSENILFFIRNGNQEVRNALEGHRQAELDDNALNNHMIIHQDLPPDQQDMDADGPAIQQKIAAAQAMGDDINPLETRKLLRFSNNNIEEYFNETPQTICNLIDSNLHLTEDDIDMILEIDNFVIDLHLLDAPHRHDQITAEHAVTIIDHANPEEVNGYDALWYLFNHRQDILGNPECVDSLVDQFFNRPDMADLLNSDLPIEQDTLNHIFNGSYEDGVTANSAQILLLLQSGRLDHQNPTEDHGMITDEELQDYVRPFMYRNDPNNQEYARNFTEALGNMQERREAAAAAVAAVKIQAAYRGMRVRREIQRGRARDAEPLNERNVRQRIE
jgi:hypothetical protein